MRLSILIPVYNEKFTIKKLLEKIKFSNIGTIQKEIIIVDDSSTDGTVDVLKKINSKDIKIFYNKTNHGKGYCIKKAIAKSSGDIVIFQDGDLEYDPNDYGKLLEPIINKKFSVVYGSRFLNKNKKGKLSFYIGNKVLSLIISTIHRVNITDMETCYKVFRSDIIKRLEINSTDFALEPEITSKILKTGIKIKEVPINYYPRTAEQGKKIKWRDGLIALKAIFYYRFFN